MVSLILWWWVVGQKKKCDVDPHGGPDSSTPNQMDVPVQLEVPFPARAFLWHCDTTLIRQPVDDAMAAMRELAIMPPAAAADRVMAATKSNPAVFRFAEADKAAVSDDDPLLAPKGPLFGLPGLYEAVINYPVSFLGFVLEHLHRQPDGTPVPSPAVPLDDVVCATLHTNRFRYVFDTTADPLPLSVSVLKVLLCQLAWPKTDIVRTCVVTALRDLDPVACGALLEDVASTQECPLATWRTLEDELPDDVWDAAPNLLTRLVEGGKVRGVEFLVGRYATHPKARDGALTALVRDNQAPTLSVVLQSELCGGLPPDDVLHHLMATAMCSNAGECMSVIMELKPRLRRRVFDAAALHAFLGMDRGLQVVMLREYQYTTVANVLRSSAATHTLLRDNAMQQIVNSPRRAGFAVSLWVQSMEANGYQEDGMAVGEWVARAARVWDPMLEEVVHVLDATAVLKMVEAGFWLQLRALGVTLPVHRWASWGGDIVPLYRATLGGDGVVGVDGCDFGLADAVAAAANALGVHDPRRVVTLVDPVTRAVQLCKRKRYRVRVFDLALRKNDSGKFSFRVVADLRRCAFQHSSVTNGGTDIKGAVTVTMRVTVRLTQPLTFRPFQVVQTVPFAGMMEGVLPRFPNMTVKRDGLRLPSRYWTSIVPEPPITSRSVTASRPSFAPTTVRRRR